MEEKKKNTHGQRWDAQGQQSRQEGNQPISGGSYWHGDEPTSLLLSYRRHYAQVKSQLEAIAKQSEPEQAMYHLAVRRLSELDAILNNRGALPPTPEPGKEETQG